MIVQLSSLTFGRVMSTTTQSFSLSFFICVFCLLAAVQHTKQVLQKVDTLKQFCVIKCNCLFTHLFIYLPKWGPDVLCINCTQTVLVPRCCENNTLAHSVATSEVFTLIEHTHCLCLLSCGAACDTLAWSAVCHQLDFSLPRECRKCR